MQKIKKVQVVPLDVNEGKIIDSFNTPDDKTQNAPSIHIVEEALNTKSNSSDVYTKTQCDDLLLNKFDKNNFSVLSGTSNVIQYNGYVYFYLDYPTGFTKDNCVVISQMCEPNLESATLQSGEVLTVAVDSNNQTQVNPRVRLTDNYIFIHIFNKTGTAKTFNYKIALMKIS